jgi:hypothetical protein
MPIDRWLTNGVAICLSCSALTAPSNPPEPSRNSVNTQTANQNLIFPAALERLADLELEACHRRGLDRCFKLSHLPGKPSPA